MNEQLIKELEKQAWDYVDATWDWSNPDSPSKATLFKTKFAELIVRECAQIAWLYDEPKLSGHGSIIANRIETHFGVEE
jgi:hypothetical protein